MLFVIGWRLRRLEEAESHLESVVPPRPPCSSAFRAGLQLTRWPSDPYSSSHSFFFCFVSLGVLWRRVYSHDVEPLTHFWRVWRFTNHKCRELSCMLPRCLYPVPLNLHPLPGVCPFSRSEALCYSPNVGFFEYDCFGLMKSFHIHPADWLTSLSFLCPKFGYIFCILHKFLLVPARCYFIVCIYCICFIRSSVCGQGCCCSELRGSKISRSQRSSIFNFLL